MDKQRLINYASQHKIRIRFALAWNNVPIYLLNGSVALSYTFAASHEKDEKGKSSWNPFKFKYTLECFRIQIICVNCLLPHYGDAVITRITRLIITWAVDSHSHRITTSDVAVRPSTARTHDIDSINSIILNCGLAISFHCNINSISTCNRTNFNGKKRWQMQIQQSNTFLTHRKCDGIFLFFFCKMTKWIVTHLYIHTILCGKIDGGRHFLFYAHSECMKCETSLVKCISFLSPNLSFRLHERVQFCDAIVRIASNQLLWQLYWLCWWLFTSWDTLHVPFRST